MAKIETYTYEGNPITFTKDNNVMVNATEMAKPFGKRIIDWLNNQSTKNFIAALCEVRKSVSSDLVKVIHGDNGGTWMHEDVAMEFARWLSPIFAIWCNDRIKELISKGYSMMPDFSNPAEAARAWADEYERRQLAERENLKLTERIEEMEPKVSYYDQVLQSPDLVTTTQIAADYGMSAKTFNQKLASLGIQRKMNCQWLLRNGYTQSKTSAVENGKGVMTVMWTYWTQKGRLFVYDLFKQNGILPLIERDDTKQDDCPVIVRKIVITEL